MKYVNYNYKITELLEEMNTSINNIDAVCKHQSEVIDALRKVGDISKFKEFIDGTENMIKQYEEQKRKLVYRKACLEECKAMLSKETYFLTMLLEGFGIANQECKSVEEREKNKEEVIKE